MGAIRQSGIVYEFGGLRLDTTERLLTRGDDKISLAPKVFDTLVVLVENSGRLLEKDELLSALWPDTFVEEATLARNISDLRRALGESTGNKFIETIPKRGYRFSSEVTRVSGLVSRRSDAISSAQEISKSEPATGAAVIAIAILPFHSISTASADEYLELGVADALITRLSNVSQIVVRPTSSVRKYLGIDKDSVEAGRELKVTHVLDGGIQRIGERLRVTAQLVGVENGRSLWAGTFDERFTDIFGVEDAISQQVAEALVSKLTGEERRLITRRDTDNAEAHRLYLRGRFHWNKRTREGYERGIEHFERSIEIDTAYALAHAGLADCYSMLGRFGLLSPGETMPRAVSAAATALDLDNTFAESHASMALAAHIYLWDWARAEHHYKRAIELNPRFATAHHWLAIFFAERGQPEEARAHIKQAQNLDPVSLIIGADAGMVSYLTRDYDLAIAQCRAALDMDPSYFRARMWLGCALEQRGDHQEAISEYLAARALDDTPYVLLWLARAYSISGNSKEAQKTIDEVLQSSSRVYVDWYYLAAAYAAVGRLEEALATLETARKERSCWLCRVGVDPIFDKLRLEPRFSSILEGFVAQALVQYER